MHVLAEWTGYVLTAELEPWTKKEKKKVLNHSTVYFHTCTCTWLPQPL